MAIVRCDKGHFFDDLKFSQCPYCGIFTFQEEEKTVALNIINADEKTVQLRPSEEDKKSAASEEGDNKTINLYMEKVGVDFVVGWLVCVQGPEKGVDYRVHQGFNRLGRNYNMDIIVAEDRSISGEAACAIVYDDRDNKFYAIQQAGANAYLNEVLLQDAIELRSGDLIKVGESEFEFIAFCREGRVWGRD